MVIRKAKILEKKAYATSFTILKGFGGGAEEWGVGDLESLKMKSLLAMPYFHGI